jgi:hypothetical protein
MLSALARFAGKRYHDQDATRVDHLRTGSRC